MKRTVRSIIILAGFLSFNGCTRQPDAAAASVDARVCAGCHPNEAKTYSQTGMAHSFVRATPATMNVEDFTKNSLHHKASERTYQVLRRGDRFFLRRSMAEGNVWEAEIHYVMGSGRHSRSYLHRTAQNRLLELPVAWYAEEGGHWGMSPGYNTATHPDFRRRVTYSCMFCHNAYPNLAPGQDVFGADAIYPEQMPEGIDCQRCHGPGSNHVRAAQSNLSKEKVRAAVVNPARLKTDRQLEICMQCHLETTSAPLPNSIRRFGRAVFSHHAGEPLADAVLFFDHGKGREEKFEIAGSAYRLRQSQCYLKSGGALSCITCHNPHRTATDFAAACQKCHASLAAAHPASKDCVTCHMPKRRTEDAVHVVMTDHKIQRRAPADALKPIAELPRLYKGEVALYYPADLPEAERDLYIAAAQVLQGTNLIPGIERLEAALKKHNPTRPEFYFQLAQAHLKASQMPQAIAAYRQALDRDANFLPALRSLGSALIDANEFQQADLMLSRAQAVSSNDAAVHHERARLLQRMGRREEAIAAARRSIQLEPDLVEAHNTLGNLLQESGDAAGAAQAYREAIRVQPDSSDAHNGLANLLLTRKDFRQAEIHFQIALRYAPSHAIAHYGYGALMMTTNRLEDARRQFEMAVAAAPSLAEGHVYLGDLAARQANWRGALAHYQRALIARPDFDSALLGMGTAWGALGDRDAARNYLRRAAQSARPLIRNEARALLRAIGDIL